MSYLVLASSSPRRQELLTIAGIPFVIDVPDIDESPLEGETPRAMVERLAQEKVAVISGKHPSRFIVGGDTTVEVDGVVLGKPNDERDAARMLRLLQGRTHVVITGSCIMHHDKAIKHYWSDSVEVEFYPMSDSDIDWYVKTGEPLDKAGAYGAQGLGMRFVKGINGSYPAVIGLNVAALAQFLKQHGFAP